MMKTVVCIMLANGRPEMVRRAVASFHAQEYKAKRLLIWNTGGDDLEEHLGDGVTVRYSGHDAIGTLRNAANTAAASIFSADVFAHWDSDDWSHPRRLTEQMELLENARAEIVGYRECLFFDTSKAPSIAAIGPVLAAMKPAVDRVAGRIFGEAWIYRTGNPAAPIGASMMYPRATWERTPFPPNHAGEDTIWLLKGRFKVHAVPSTWDFRGLPNFEPRMICSIHGANTSSKIEAGRVEWKREPLFDLYCRTRMELC